MGICEGVFIEDFRKWEPPRGDRYQVAITNPPFSIAQEVLEKCLRLAETTVLLLRLNFLGSKKRFEVFRNRMPDVYVLPTRPSFTGKGTDSIEYAWFVWPPGPRRQGMITVLEPGTDGPRRAPNGYEPKMALGMY